MRVGSRFARVLVVLLASCSSGPAADRTPAVRGAANPRTAEQATPGHGGATEADAVRRIVIRSGDGAAFELAQHFGPGTGLAIIDTTGSQAPIALFVPPHLCHSSCDGHLDPCDHGIAPIAVEAGASHTIEWDQSLRRLRYRNVSCYEQVPAIPGEYLVQACARDGRCGLTRVRVPGTDPIEVVLGPREDDVVPSCEAAETSRAIRIAMAAALAEGVVPSAVEGCPTDIRCGGAELDIAQSASCRVRVSTFRSVYLVDLRPSAREGHPGSVEVWVDRDAVHSGNLFVRDGRWSASADGEVAVIGLTQHAIHTHGGDPARISSASFRVFNRGERDRLLRIRSVHWYASHGDPQPVAGGSWRSGSTILAPARSDLENTVTFEAHQAYQASGERFAVELELELDGELLRPKAEVRVTRVDPVR